METQDAFYLVWCPTGSKSPRFRHASYSEAVAEAERLAKEVPGQEFYVLAAEAMRKVDSMVRVEFSQKIPF